MITHLGSFLTVQDLEVFKFKVTTAVKGLTALSFRFSNDWLFLSKRTAAKVRRQVGVATEQNKHAKYMFGE